jgi:cell division protein FtsW (lipid II flippase)
MSFPLHPEAIGFVGVTLLLVAFFLNLLRLLKAASNAYLALNLVGASLACVSSYLIDFLPFVLLEGTWAVVAGVALARKLRPAARG